MNKYGYENFVVSQIEECDNEKLDEREIYWISYYSSNNKKYGYNMTPGGGGGDILSHHPRKEEIIKKIKLKNTGKKRSSEFCKENSERQKGCFRIDIEKTELYQDIKNYMSIEEICKKYSISRKGFYYRCKEYFNQTPTEIRGDKLKHSNTLKITSISKEEIWKLLKENKSLAEMANYFNVSKETVRRRIVEYYGKNLKEMREYVKSKD